MAWMGKDLTDHLVPVLLPWGKHSTRPACSNPHPILALGIPQIIYPADYFIIAIPFETRIDFQVMNFLRMNFWRSICTWAGNSVFCWVHLMGCTEGMCLKRWNAAHSEDQAAAWGFGVQKYHSLYSRGSSRLGFGALHTQIFNLNKAVLKPCISEQKSKVRTEFYQSPRDWIMGNKLKWAGRSAVLTSSELEPLSKRLYFC